MERADDSCGILADLARDHFPKYFTAPWREAGLSPELLYRDFIEYAVWEDYGLLGPQELEPFFKTVQKADVMFIGGGKSWREGSSISDVVVCWFGTFVQIRTRFD
jgi:hypothetical protein